jgi:hypothetical protein
MRIWARVVSLQQHFRAVLLQSLRHYGGKWGAFGVDQRRPSSIQGRPVLVRVPIWFDTFGKTLLSAKTTNQRFDSASRWNCLFSALQSGHWQLKIAAVQLDPEPHFVDRKSLL